MREVWEIKLPISAGEAQVGMLPAEWLEQAVRRLGKLTRLEGVVLDTGEIADAVITSES